MSFWEDFNKDELEEQFLKSFAVRLQLTRNPWDFSRGAKTIRKYTSGGFDRISVEYSYIYPQDENGNDNLRDVVGIEREKVCFLEEDGSVFHHYDVPNSDGEFSISRLNIDIRNGRIRFLEGSGEALRDAFNDLPEFVDQATVEFLVSQKTIPPTVVDVASYHSFRIGLLTVANGIDEIFEHYKAEISNYRTRRINTGEFEDAVKSETDPHINSLLDLPTPPNEDFPAGLTVRQAIFFQLVGDING